MFFIYIIGSFILIYINYLYRAELLDCFRALVFSGVIIIIVTIIEKKWRKR